MHELAILIKAILVCWQLQLNQSLKMVWYRK